MIAEQVTEHNSVNLNCKTHSGKGWQYFETSAATGQGVGDVIFRHFNAFLDFDVGARRFSKTTMTVISQLCKRQTCGIVSRFLRTWRKCSQAAARPEPNSVRNIFQFSIFVFFGAAIRGLV